MLKTVMSTTLVAHGFSDRRELGWLLRECYNVLGHLKE